MRGLGGCRVSPRWGLGLGTFIDCVPSSVAALRQMCGMEGYCCSGGAGSGSLQ